MPNSDIKELNSQEIFQLRHFLRNFDSHDAINIVIPTCYSILVERGAIPETVEVRQRRYTPSHYPSINDRYAIQSLREYLNHCDNETLKSYVRYFISDSYLRYSGRDSITETCSTEDLSRLVYGLLKIEDGDFVYDLGSGLGAILTNIYTEALGNGIHIRKLQGCEIISELAELSEMIVTILTDGQAYYSVRIGDAFGSDIDYPYSSSSSATIEGNKGYVYPPIALRPNRRYKYYHSDLFGSFELNSSIEESWLFIDKLLSSLDRSNSRAVALVAGRALFNMNRNSYAQRLVKAGFLEGIIELPNNHMPSTSIPMYLLVFSQGNTKVKSIYAGDCILNDNKRTHHPYNNLDVDKILKLYDSVDGNKCGYISCEDLCHISNWIPSSMPFAITNHQNDSYTPLSNVTKIGVGCGYTSSAFETSDTPTDYRILTSGDIDEYGLIKWDTLPYIKMDKTLYDKFVIHKGDVVITTKSTKVKVAVVDKEPEEKVILTGGMIKVTPDTTKLNPTYLKMFLDSDEGAELLKSCSSGSVMIHLSLNTFKDIKIPLIDLDKQNKKAIEYNEKLTRVTTYQQRIKEINDEINEFINSKEDEE